MDDTRFFGNAYDDEDVGTEVDLNNLETTINVSPIPTTRIDKDHPKDQIIGDFNSTIQTRRMTKFLMNMLCQDKYVAAILKKFNFATMKTTSTPMEPNKALIKDEEADSVDVHLYKSMIGSLMYLTASTPDITFAICACARFQVTPKTSHLHAVKRIFRYLKANLNWVLWGYSEVTRPFNKYSEYKNSIFYKKVNIVRVKDTTARDRVVGNPQQKEYKKKGVINSGCSRHMTGNK
ncbi:hypothetical protein Tco_0248300 [Tanacetum coccineum]